jgi:hypothetical protein
MTAILLLADTAIGLASIRFFGKGYLPRKRL